MGDRAVMLSVLSVVIAARPPSGNNQGLPPKGNIIPPPNGVPLIPNIHGRAANLGLSYPVRIAQLQPPSIPPQPTVQTDPRQDTYNQIKAIFENEVVYKEWEAWITKQNPNIKDLVSYAKALKQLKDFLGKTNFEKVLITPFGNDTNNIIVKQTRRMTPPRSNTEHDTYQGVVLDHVAATRLKNAVWMHGNDYGTGKIGAPYVACSSIEKRISPTQVIQQIVFDIPFPAANLMTMNDTSLSSHGGFGWEIQWTGLEDKNAPWKCLDTDNKETDFNFNFGQWRFLPIAGEKTIIWYATQSDSKSLNAPDSTAKSALRDNILAFSSAAHGKYGQ